MEFGKNYVVMVNYNGVELCYKRTAIKDNQLFFDFAKIRSQGYKYDTEKRAIEQSSLMKSNGYNSWVESIYVIID